jgi:hypothetical protein
MRRNRGEIAAAGPQRETPARSGVLMRERCLARARYCLDIAESTDDAEHRRLLTALSRSYAIMASCCAGAPARSTRH